MVLALHAECAAERRCGRCVDAQLTSPAVSV